MRCARPGTTRIRRTSVDDAQAVQVLEARRNLTQDLRHGNLQEPAKHKERAKFVSMRCSAQR